MSKNKASWFALMVLAGFLAGCGQQTGDQGTTGTGADRDDTAPPPTEPANPPAGQ